MAGIERICQDILASHLTERCSIDLFRTNIPLSLRPRSSTQAFTWNILARDGLVGAAGTLAVAIGQAARLAVLISTTRYDVMHLLSTAGFGFLRNGLHLALARLAGVRTVFHLLGQVDDLYRDAGPPLRFVIRQILGLSDVIVVQSPGLAEFFAPLTRSPVVSVFNGVRVRDFRDDPGLRPSASGKIRALALGVMGHKKGTFDVIEAADRLRSRAGEFMITLAGGGETEHFRELVRRKGLGGIVEVRGPVSEDERIRLLRTSDIFLLPSRAEGLPIAILEAMAAGLPVISTSVGSIPEVVTSENGIVVTPGDIDAIAAAIVRLVDDAALRRSMGQASRASAEARFDISRFMDEIAKLYLGEPGATGSFA